MQAVAQSPASVRLPPLQSGDEMDSAEFLRRCEAEAEENKAELIEGVVYMAPLSTTEHAEPDGLIHGWLGAYALSTPGTRFLPNATLLLSPGNTPQPDAMLIVHPKHGGRARLRGKYLAGAPELIAETAASSVALDLRGKLRAYRRAGVREYLVWNVTAHEFQWFRLRGNNYVLNRPDADGFIHSSQFPGLRLDAEALLEMDGRRVLAALQTGLDSAEHAAFIARLGAA